MEETNGNARMEAIEKHLQELAAASRTVSVSYGNGRDSSFRRCWTCGQLGHLRSKCTRRERIDSQKSRKEA